MAGRQGGLLPKESHSRQTKGRNRLDAKQSNVSSSASKQANMDRKTSSPAVENRAESQKRSRLSNVPAPKKSQLAMKKSVTATNSNGPSRTTLVPGKVLSMAKSGPTSGTHESAGPTVKRKEKLTWSQVTGPSDGKLLPGNLEDVVGSYLPSKKVPRGRMKSTPVGDLEDVTDEKVVGALRTITHEEKQSYEAVRPEVPVYRFFCNSIDEERRNKKIDVEEEEASSESDGQYDTDLEEDFPTQKFNSSPSGREIYEFTCKRKGLIPASFLLSRFTCPEVLLPHHGLGPKGGRALATALVVNTYIETLDVSDNDLQENGGSAFASMLYENFYISDLDLSENSLGTSGGIEIAKALIVNRTVMRLVLRGNQLNDSVAKVFAEVLQENRRLCVLDLSYNRLGEKGGLYLGAGLSLNHGLTLLDLKWNAIGGKGAIAIAQALSTNVTLRSLNLSWNSFGYRGALALSTSLLSNEHLRHLDLKNNRLCESSILKLIPAFANHKSLVEIKIGQNPIGHKVINNVFEAAARNPKIKHIGLEDISVPNNLLPVIKELECERDAIILTDKKTRLATKEPEKEGMNILMEFLQENSLRLKEMFSRLDKDKSGDITRTEFKSGLKEMGILMDSRQLDLLIRKIDKDKNDKIDYSEILGGHRTARLEKQRETQAQTKKEKVDQAAMDLPELGKIKTNLLTQKL